MNKKTYTAATLMVPATEKQIRAIISINNQYIIKGIVYPEYAVDPYTEVHHALLTKIQAQRILNDLTAAIPTAEKRPFDKDMYYTLYERLAVKYPENHISAPVRDYRVDTEAIPDDNIPAQHKPLPNAKTIKHTVADKAFMNKVMSDFMKGE